MSQRSMRDGVLTIKDGSTNELIVKVGEGNISWSEKREIQYSHDRGLVTEARFGDDQPCDVKFDFIWEWLSSLSGTSVSEALNGEADGWVTTGDDCEPYAVDLELTIYNPNNDLMETITFTEFRKTQLDYDLRAGTVSCSGQCKAGGPVAIDSRVLIKNGSFSTNSDWTIYGSALEITDGKCSAKSPWTTTKIYQNVNVVAGAQYEFSVDITGENGGSKFLAIDPVGSYLQPGGTRTYTYTAVYSIAIEVGLSVTFSLGHAVSFDNFSFRRIS